MDPGIGKSLDGLIISNNICKGFYWGISFLSGTIMNSLIQGNDVTGNTNAGMKLRVSVSGSKVVENLGYNP